MDKILAEFANLAREYCYFVNTAAVELEIKPRLEAARLLLARLIATGSQLPQGDPVSSDTEYQPPLPNWPGVEKHNYYWEIYDPFNYDSDKAVAGDLNDDILDVYNDLMEGLFAFDKGDLSSAAWHWGWSFDAHWGIHATAALKALHFAISRGRDLLTE